MKDAGFLVLCAYENIRVASTILLVACDGTSVASGDGMQTAALADCERLRTNVRHA